MKRKILTIIVVVLTLLLGLYACMNYYLNKMERTEINIIDEEEEEDNSSNEEPSQKYDDNVINIALFGIDSRSGLEGARSDAIIIATLNKNDKSIKLSSIMRDLYVDIPNHGMDKINHSFMFGGPELAIKTINNNFDLNIQDFITVDFFGLEEIIDLLGGVEINVTRSEVYYINAGTQELDDITKSKTTHITKAGIQTLTGRQAVAYCRIRKIGSDYERTTRQRRVLEQVINKGLSLKLWEYPKLLDTILPNVETSLSNSEILSYATSTLTLNIKNIQQLRIPISDHAKGKMINGVYYLVPNTLEDNVLALHEFIKDKIKDSEI